MNFLKQILIVDFLANETRLVTKSKIYMWTQKVCHNRLNFFLIKSKTTSNNVFKNKMH